jgi:hypothetical protein
VRAQGLFLIGNYLLFLVACFAALGVQCSLWLQILGSTPAPSLWMPFLVYLSLYRYRFESMAGIYLVAAAASSFSVCPFGMLLLVNLLLYLAMQLFKERIYWNGVGFFALVVAGASTIFTPLMMAISWVFDKNPIREMLLVNSIVSILLTVLFSFPLYSLFTAFDRWSHKELPTETGTQIL